MLVLTYRVADKKNKNNERKKKSRERSRCAPAEVGPSFLRVVDLEEPELPGVNLKTRKKQNRKTKQKNKENEQT